MPKLMTLSRLRTLLVLALAAFVPLAAAQVAQPVAPVTAAAAKQVETIALYTGEVKILRLTDIERVAVGNGELLSVSHLANELVIIGTATGYTNLVVWTRDGRLLAYNVDVKGPKTASVEMRRMIYLTVQVVDFRKSVLSRLGINWQQAVAGPVLGIVTNWVNNPYFRIGDTNQGGADANRLRGPSGTLNGLPLDESPQAFFGITSSLSSVINLAAQNGDAYILASPQLSTRSGGSADFLAGGEVPIPITSGLGQVSVQYKEYGIKLTIRPEADDYGQILASIDTEVSQIDPSVTVNSFPGFLTRRASSAVNVLSNQTIVLSGLMQANGSDNVTEVPWLGKVPVLGKLFSSRDYQAARSELVIFVTPTVFDVESPLNSSVVRRGLDHVDAFHHGPGREVYAPGFGSGPVPALPAPLPKNADAAAEADRAAMRAGLVKTSQQPEAVKDIGATGPLVIDPPTQSLTMPAAAPASPTMIETGLRAIEPESQPEPQPVAVLPFAEQVPVPGGMQWGVQVSSSVSEEDSRALLAALQQEGHNGGMRRVENLDQENAQAFVVRLGPYETRAAADQARQQISPRFPTAMLVLRDSLFDLPAATASDSASGPSASSAQSLAGAAGN